MLARAGLIQENLRSRSSLSVPYDLTLNGTRSFPSSQLTGGQASWPTEPSLNSVVNVSAGNFTSLQNAVDTPGAVVNVPAGTYSGDLLITAVDTDIILADGAIIDGSVEFGDFFGASIRCRWTGGQIAGVGAGGTGDRIYVRGDDVLINNLHVTSGNAFLLEGARKFALINSTIESDYYAIFAFEENQDVILANNLFTTTSPDQATLRLQNFARGIVVDNRSVSGAGNRALRIHKQGYNAQDYWVANNEFIGQTPASHMWVTEDGGGVPTAGLFGRIYLSDNVIYSNQDFYADTDIGPESSGGDIYVYNTTSYNNNYASNTDFVNEVSITGMDWVNNVRQPYQAPAAFTGGADH